MTAATKLQALAESVRPHIGSAVSACGINTYEMEGLWAVRTVYLDGLDCELHEVRCLKKGNRARLEIDMVHGEKRYRWTSRDPQEALRVVKALLRPPQE